MALINTGKQGQVTIFIILGVLLLIVAGFIFYLGSENIIGTSSSFETLGDLSVMGSVGGFIGSCLEDASYLGISKVLANGGYYSLDEVDFVLENALENYNDYDFFSVPYYFVGGEDFLPEIEDITSEFEIAIAENFVVCIDDFAAYAGLGHVFESSDPIITVTLVEGGSFVDLDYYLLMHSDDSSSEFESTEMFIAFDFIDKYEQIQKFLSRQTEDPDAFAIGALSSVLRGTGYYYEYLVMGEEGSELLVNVYYPVRGQTDDFVYSFALSYDWGTLESNLNLTDDEDSVSPVILYNLEDWDVVDYGLQYYQVEAKGDNLVYVVSPETLDIDSESGLITLDSSDYSNAAYLYFIRVTDSENRSVEGPLLININVNEGDLAIFEEFENSTFSVGDTINMTLSVSNEEYGPYYFTAETGLFDIDKQSAEFSFEVSSDELGSHQVYFSAENENGVSWMLWDFEVVAE